MNRRDLLKEALEESNVTTIVHVDELGSISTETSDLPPDVLPPWAAKAMMKDVDHIVSMIRDMEESSAGEDWYDAKRLAIRNTLLEWYDIGYGTALENTDDGTDWEYLRSMTPEQIHQAALDDPDNPPLTPEQLARFRPASEWGPLHTRLREARERGERAREKNPDVQASIDREMNEGFDQDVLRKIAREFAEEELSEKGELEEKAPLIVYPVFMTDGSPASYLVAIFSTAEKAEAYAEAYDFELEYGPWGDKREDGGVVVDGKVGS